jgi:hypothetical protein
MGEEVVVLTLQRRAKLLTQPEIPLEHCEERQRMQPLTLLQKPKQWPETMTRREVTRKILEAVQPLLRPGPRRLKRVKRGKNWSRNRNARDRKCSVKKGNACLIPCLAHFTSLHTICMTGPGTRVHPLKIQDIL